jgi:DNA-binding CsgD family transcriptional regulator
VRSELVHGACGWPSATAVDVDLAAASPRDRTFDEFVRTFGRLLAESDTWLATVDCGGCVACASGPESVEARPEEVLCPATVAHLRELLSDMKQSGTGSVQIIGGKTMQGRAIECRVAQLRSGDECHLVLVRATTDVDADQARIRSRQMRAALQAVADIVLPLEELQGHDEARRRAALVASLSDRERRIALAVANGVRTAQIANDLFVSQSTVRNYLPTIYRKLGVRSRACLVELLNSSE